MQRILENWQKKFIRRMNKSRRRAAVQDMAAARKMERKSLYTVRRKIENKCETDAGICREEVLNQMETETDEEDKATTQYFVSVS